MATYNFVRQAFEYRGLFVSRESFATSFALNNDTGTVQFSVSRQLKFGEGDLDALLSFIYKGNTFLISAKQIDSTLLKAIGVKLSIGYQVSDLFSLRFKNTHTRLVKDIANPMDSAYEYYYFPFINSFSDITNENIRVVGYNEEGDPNFILLFFGKGRLYLHCDPRAFSNYFILKDNNHDYLGRILQLFPEKTEGNYWNTYYNKTNSSGKGKSSMINNFLKEPPLKWALLLLLGLMLFFIAFNGKRRQRIVPVIKPVQNSSVAFAEAIASLYLKQNDNKVIADKMISYFNEFVKSHFNIHTSHQGGEFISSLSRKSGISQEITKDLYDHISSVQGMSSVSDQQLLKLNSLIQEFYKTKK